jgi:hypothetical protein
MILVVKKKRKKVHIINLWKMMGKKKMEQKIKGALNYRIIMIQNKKVLHKKKNKKAIIIDLLTMVD